MLVKLAFVMQRLIKKISKKIFFMINKDRGHSCYEGGHRAHGGPPVPPPTRENPEIYGQL